MNIGVLITNGGPHTALRWAETTAAQIVELIEVDEKSASSAAEAARRAKPRLELALTDALEKHHTAVQEKERGHLTQLGIERYNHSLDAAEQVPDELTAALDEVVRVISSVSTFGSHFDSAPVRGVVRGIVANHFNSVMHVERIWHKSRVA